MRDPGAPRHKMLDGVGKVVVVAMAILCIAAIWINHALTVPHARLATPAPMVVIEYDVDHGSGCFLPARPRGKTFFINDCAVTMNPNAINVLVALRHKQCNQIAELSFPAVGWSWFLR